MYVKNDISQVKRDISRFIGSRVKLESNKGRHKAIITQGTIENVYPSIFTISLDSEELTKRTVSYSYTDVLTRAIEITVFD